MQRLNISIFHYFFCFVFLSLIFVASTVLAQESDAIFKQITTKGNVILEFFTTGWFAIALVTGALIYVTVGVINGKMEITRAILVVVGCIFLGNIPVIAKWLVGA